MSSIEQLNAEYVALHEEVIDLIRSHKLTDALADHLMAREQKIISDLRRLGRRYPDVTA